MITDRIAAQRPDAIAVEDGATSVSYRELWSWSGAIAATLRGRGIGREDVVAVRCGRTLEHVVAILGVWRAGAAFLPLDPGAPLEREGWILDDVGARATLGVEDVRAARTLDHVDRAGHRDDLAYVIATSGSTGRPKGVEVLHRGLLPVLDAQRDAFAIDEDSRVLWMLSPAFDASISDIGTALTAGATLVIAPEGISVDALETLLERAAITHVDLPPSLLPLLTRVPATLRTIVIGGEICALDAVRAWSSRVRLVNVYGPTEATICTSLGVCDGAWDRPKIGVPLPHVRYRVVDGELWIGGDALARGYRRRPELTAASFVVEDGERWYRTRDRVAPCEGGDHVFLGRLDRQIKRNGRLVEPAEIEAALTSDPRITRAAVVVHESAGLVAFVVAREPVDTSALTNRLPRWMIPNRVERVTALPETSSGKIDLAALAKRPIAHVTQGDRDDAYARLWSEILGLDVGADDDLASLGADSFAILRLVALAEARGLGISVTAAAAARTPRALSAVLPMTADALRADVATFARRASTSARSERPRVIAITGATGLLGRRFVARLRERTSARMITLDRPRADLDQPRLGLSIAEWNELAETVDTIVHMAARVNMLASYAELRETNVAGTARILELASTARPKTLHHVSTLSVFVATDRDHGIAYEDDDLAATKLVHGGYAQSKFAAELLARGAPSVRIHRLGLLTGHRADFLSMFIRGVASLGAIPKGVDPGLRVDITPADFAAEALARLVTHDEPAREATYHVASDTPASLGDLLGAMADEGIAIACADGLVARTDEEAAALLALCRGTASFDRHRTMDLFQATGIRFDDARARAALGDLDRPRVDRALLRRYVRIAMDPR